LLASLSGDELPDPVVAPSGQMYIVWRSDNFDQAPGWSAHWETGNVGIELEEAFNEFNLYPNPATEEISISFETNKAENLIVEIISPSGKVMYSNKIDSFTGNYTNTVDVSKFAKGVYFLRLHSSEGAAAKKIIVE